MSFLLPLLPLLLWTGLWIAGGWVLAAAFFTYDAAKMPWSVRPLD